MEQWWGDSPYKEHSLDSFPELAAELREDGVEYGHVTAVKGADPKLVEREWRMMLDRMKYGAVTQTRMNYDWWIAFAWGWIVGKVRSLMYKFFREKKFLAELDSKMLLSSNGQET